MESANEREGRARHFRRRLAMAGQAVRAVVVNQKAIVGRRRRARSGAPYHAGFETPFGLDA